MLRRDRRSRRARERRAPRASAPLALGGARLERAIGSVEPAHRRSAAPSAPEDDAARSRRARAHRRGAAVPLHRPAQRRRARRRHAGRRGRRRAPRSRCSPSSTRPGAAASRCASSAAAGRSPATRPPRTPRGGCSAARAPPTLTPAQAETLAIVAYLQPISRPEITRIRGVSADSATATLLERGLIEEAGHSQFGAVLYRTTTQFLKLFGLRSLDELPDVARWDPTPEEQAELRERLLRAGEARAGWPLRQPRPTLRLAGQAPR